MASPSLFEIGDSYKDLHATISQSKPPVSLGENEFCVGILEHWKAPPPVSCLWFKVKVKHSVAKLKKAYEDKVKVQVHLKFANRLVSDSTQVHQLNYLKDNVVVFIAHEDNTSLPTSSASAATPTRVPLQPIGGQLSADLKKNFTDGKASIKEENTDPSSLASTHPNVQTQQVKHESGQTLVDLRNLKVPPQMGPFTAPKQQSLVERIRIIVAEARPEVLEAEVKSSQRFLESLKQPLVGLTTQHKDAQHWVAQIETLQKQQVETPTVIGVVGNTGAGKSSVINAMLEEERLVPTNCMRACTAVVTEMSWNSSNDPNAKYRADIEFIQAEDWAKDLKLSLQELMDGNGQVSRDCTKADSEAGIAYAKIKAVYPSKTKEMLASSTVEELMREPAVKNVLGTTRKISKASSDTFYKALQSFVDSKEKSTKDKNDKEPKQMEFWPLIKVVRIYTKADALSTGAVIVDLPGVHDSNAARAAVAAGYMKQCTGLFIVAPINRAVDDKAAKSLLGESFKRQLKFDGTYSRITFICSKTDDISVTEASDSLGLEDEMAADYQKIAELDKEQSTIKTKIKDLKELKAVYQDVINDSDDAIELWEELKDQAEAGNTVYASSSQKSKKRKRSSGVEKSRKKSNSRRSGCDDKDDDFINDEENAETSAPESDGESEKGDPLTEEVIEAKISQFKEDKKRARQEKFQVDANIKILNQELKASEKKRAEIDAAMSALCIEGRNKYSKGAIQQDFADGIRELDMENAQEEDPENFNPDEQIRDYDEVARSLPVICVSSRAYQKLQGRLQRDTAVPGFRTAEETEIPQLQAHCKLLTEAGRASNCRAYLTNLCQLLNSLGLWASTDCTSLNMTDAQLAAETGYLKTALKTLEKGLEGAVKSALKDMVEALTEHIFEKYPELVEKAIEESNKTVSRWHSPINRDNRALGGFFWGTYKAIMRREGVFSNAQGLHDLNLQLTEPIIKHLASHWERVFSQRLPRVLQSFSRSSKNLLTAFHRDIELRSMKVGSRAAGMALLGQQLRNYEALFATLSQQMIELINAQQREANREFTPVIARNLSRAYDWCANESGTGMFVRIKSHMASHIDSVRLDMFSESCNDVRERLFAMCSAVEQAMSIRTDEVFVAMQRDYLEVVSGARLSQAGMMPHWERKMRSDVASIIDDRDRTADDDVKGIVNAAAKAEIETEAISIDANNASPADNDIAVRKEAFQNETIRLSEAVAPPPHELLIKLIKKNEPERSSQWLRCLFEEDAEGSVPQFALWQAYQESFAHTVAETGIPLLPGADFIKIVSKVFGSAPGQVLEGPLKKYIIKGIRRRTAPVDAMDLS